MQAQKNGYTILVGEDELEVREYLEMALKCLGYSVELAQDGNEILNYLASSRPRACAVLLDLMMPQRDGIDTLREIRRIDPNLPVIIVSGAASTLNVVTAMKTGATDFLCKPVAHDDLRKAIHKALQNGALQNGAPQNRALQNGIGVEPAPLAPVSSTRTKVFLGNNPRMHEIHSLVEHIGWSEAPILIQGETGTGKEVFARELHANSPRAGKIFLKLNCAALPSELVESELFGYERGAFTGAFQKKAGMFETADGGTILLDEIGDMDIRLQAKLLQVLQDREFHRIGGKDVIKVDVRVLAATHRDLEKAIEERTFREDLYYRLNVINVHLPPLRERKEDIVPLTEHLLRKHGVAGKALPDITLDLKHSLMTYDWPGNVRELENLVRKLTILRNPDVIARELHAKAARRPLPAVAAGAVIRSETNPETVYSPGGTTILEQVSKAKQQAETEAILAALDSTRWNRKQAAALLKIDYKALLYKMKKLGLEDKPCFFTPPSAEAPGSVAADSAV